MSLRTHANEITGHPIINAEFYSNGDRFVFTFKVSVFVIAH